MNSDGQIDQLSDLGFKTQMESKNLSREKREEILENEMRGGEERNFERGAYKKYGDAASKVEIGEIENMGHFFEFLLGDTGRRILIWGGFAYAVGNKPISVGHTKT